MSLTDLRLCIEDFYSKNHKNITLKYQDTEGKTNFIDFEFTREGIFPENLESALDEIFAEHKSKYVDLDDMKLTMAALLKEDFDNELPSFNYTL
jgi:hypothetical protein